MARRSARQATLFIEPAKCDLNVRLPPGGAINCTVRNLSSTGAMLDVASRVERRPISSAPFVRSESGPRLDATLREVRAKILPFRAQKSDRLLPTPASSGFAITC
jgi:hypothetical protein